MQAFKTFIIHLSGNEHSENMARQCQEQAKKFDIDAKLFEGIYGDDVFRHYVSTGVPRPKKRLKKGRIGVLGCFFSHYYLWKDCSRDTVPYLILEHDGYMLRPITEDILNSFTDVLKLDGCDPFGAEYNNVLKDGLKETDIKIEKYWNNDAKNPKKIGTGNYFKGAYAYILKPAGAKKIIDFIHRNENGKGHRTADQQIGDGVLDTRVTVPSLARLHPFYSEGTNIKTESLTRNLEEKHYERTER